MKLRAEGMSGRELRTIREAQLINGRSMYRQEFAERIHSNEQQVKRWETSEAPHGVPPPTALLIRITFDARIRAQWLQERGP